MSFFFRNMSLPWSDDTGLRPDDVFTNCDVPKNLIGCIGFATEQIDQSLTASLVSPDVLVQAMNDCNDFIFNDELDSKISTMMSDCNQVCFLVIFSLPEKYTRVLFRLFKIYLLLRRLDLIICSA